MKKLLTVIAIGALSCLWLLPTASFAAEIRGGLKAGVNLSSIHGADVGDIEFELGAPWKSKLGAVGGGFITFNLSPTIAIQAEALYSMKGAKLNTTVDTTPVTVTFNGNYLEIPILLKIMIPTQGNLKPSLFAGPALGINLSHKVKAEGGGMSEEIEIPGYKSTDLGLVFGLGLDIGRNIRTDLRYTLGFTKLVEEGGVTSDIKNGAFSLMIGYCF